MSKILDVNNMLDAAANSDMPEFDELCAKLESAAKELADKLAAHLGIEAGSADYEQGFGGLCVTFSPKHPGQECPDVIDQGDEGGDWE